ncbi:MAG: DNA repair protein RecO [Rhodospirillales bacterium]|jgi:DNA repair protein RecO (recombination protein O)|nr:DNA repair protein RecO [Rhodospirillales bacterium]
MDWTDDGIVLTTRKFGESGLIVSLLTREHGRHAGLVRGGSGKRAAGMYEPGNLVQAVWRARLEEQLGSLACEVRTNHAARHLAHPARLAALISALSLVETALPEREPYQSLFDSLSALLVILGEEGWEQAYIRWEMILLAELGFGIDLSCCAATGVNDQLAYVSPKSGRAVSLSAGEPWKDKLLKLPGFLVEEAGGSIADGLQLTGFFLESWLFNHLGRPVPAARTRLVDRLG